KYEGTITWPLIVGPGFCGATHPGAENIFNIIMVSSNGLIYNSDCLYVNPSQKVFAISDAPGMSTRSRKLFAKLDHYLQTSSIDDLETIINDLNKETRMGDRATLSLVCFSKNSFGEALAFVAGDTYLFHGNIFHRRMGRIEDNAEFIGTPHIHFKPKRIDLAEGDFFVIVSDGITSIRGNNHELKLEEILWDHINGDLENFAFTAIKSCNSILGERIFNRVITRFGGSDNVSALLVYPEKLIDSNYKGSIILGGDVGERMA
ncbi:MAG: hypothetical protein COS88_04895, partial [Chloroflexi bacterium CG07_land_8_20_14_0_80_51_10]